jgi:putative ABC transport system permease protein
VPLGSARTDAWRDEARDELMAAVLTREGSDRSAVKAEVARRVATISPPPPFERVELWADTPLEALSRELFGPEEAHVERLIALLALAALAFMALPALNLVTLAMSRSLERACEIGVRRAYGASRWQLGAQLIAETFVTTVLGALVALALAALALELLEASGTLPGADLTLGPATLAGSGLLAAVFALLSGALPAWRMARLHPIDALSGRSDR